MKLQKKICDSVPVVVLSDSMHPTISQGQKVFVYPATNKLCIGDIILYKHWDYSLTVHRIVGISKSVNNTRLFHTKGDNNDNIDPYSITEHDIIGIVKS